MHFNRIAKKPTRKSAESKGVGYNEWRAVPGEVSQADEKVAWAFTHDSAEETLRTKLVSKQLLARICSEDLRCLFRELTGRKKRIT